MKFRKCPWGCNPIVKTRGCGRTFVHCQHVDEMMLDLWQSREGDAEVKALVSMATEVLGARDDSRGQKDALAKAVRDVEVKFDIRMD